MCMCVCVHTFFFSFDESLKTSGKQDTQNTLKTLSGPSSLLMKDMTWGLADSVASSELQSQSCRVLVQCSSAWCLYVPVLSMWSLRKHLSLLISWKPSYASHLGIRQIVADSLCPSDICRVPHVLCKLPLSETRNVC